MSDALVIFPDEYVCILSACWMSALLELIGGDYPNLRPPDEVNSRIYKLMIFLLLTE